MVKKPRNPKRGLSWGQGSCEVRGTKYIARWMEDDRKRSRTFYNQDDCEDFLRARHRRMVSGRWVDPQDRTVADLIEGWLERNRNDWKPNTYATYRMRAESHVLPSLGDVPAHLLTVARVQHWIDGLRRQGYSPSMIDAATRVLSAAYREAMGLEIVSTNPVAHTKRPDIQKRAVTVWTVKEVQAVLHVLRDSPMWHALYRLTITTGIRPGELRALRWTDIDLPKRTMTIQRTMTRDDDYRVIVGTSTKTGSSRIIALSPSATDALQVWRDAQKVVTLDGYVFTRSDGQWLPHTVWQRFHAKLCRKAKVTKITLHGIRHTSATLDMARGVNPRIVADRLGHSSITTTLDVYSHPSVEMQREIADALDDLLDTKNG